MGTKLCNLQIYNPDRREYSLAPGYTVVRIAEGWDTIFEDEPSFNYNKVAKLARDLSNELDAPVISVNYFDDDVFELNITVAGKKEAYYSNSYGKIFTKKVPVMVDALRLDDKDAKAFKYLIKRAMSAPEAIDSISAIAGLPLYSDMLMYKEVPDKLIPDKETVFDELKKEKVRNKITAEKAEVIQEFPGAAVYYYVAPSPADNYKGIIRVVEDPTDYGKVTCYQIAEGPVPYLKKVHDYYIPIHEYTEKPKNTNVWITCHQMGTEDFYLDFGEPPHYGYYHTKDETEKEKYNKLTRIPEENLSNPPYEVGELFAEIHSSKLPKHEYQDVKETDKGIFVKRYLGAMEKWQGDYIIRPSYYTEYGTSSHVEYAMFEFWNSNYELVRTERVPIDFLKTNFPLSFTDFVYIEERNTVVYGHYVIDLTGKTLTVSDKIPGNNYFIEKRTIDGKPLLIIGTTKYVHVYDYDFNRLKSYSITGHCISWFFDSDDNLYVVTSPVLHGRENRGMKPTDKIKLYKMHISV